MVSSDRTNRKTSRGRTLLLTLLQNVTEASIAQKVGRTAAGVSAWATGLCLPGYGPRVILEREYSIPGSAWDEAD